MSGPLRARQVLNDARRAIDLCENAKNDQDFRVHWVAAIALLRAVGHVLRNVDAKDSGVASAVNALWAEWKNDSAKHEIFWEFIEQERNMTLKDYELSFWRDTPTIPFVVTKTPLDGGGPEAEKFDMSVDIYRPMVGGPYDGEDARDALSAGADWWDGQLSILGASLTAHCLAMNGAEYEST